jgi:hypothetical protein
MRIKHNITVDINSLPRLLKAYINDAVDADHLLNQLSFLLGSLGLSEKNINNFDPHDLANKIIMFRADLGKLDLCLEEISDILKTLIEYDERRKEEDAEKESGEKNKILNFSEKMVSDLKNLKKPLDN